MLTIKRKLRKVPSGNYIVEKWYELFGIRVTPRFVDWPTELSNYKEAIKAIIWLENEDANR